MAESGTDSAADALRQLSSPDVSKEGREEEEKQQQESGGQEGEEEEEEEESEGEDVEDEPHAVSSTLKDAFHHKTIQRVWKHDSPTGLVHWTLTVHPKGRGDHKGNIGIFVALDETSRFLPGWYREARVTMKLVNLKEETESISKTETWRFSAKNKWFGWDEFCPTDMISKDKKGVWRDKEKDGFKIEVTTQILREKGCSSAYTSRGWGHDSFKVTGFCGLKNQGATCYLNSLLQALYFISPFRASVYALPTEDDTPSDSIPLALQRVFYQLQFGNSSVSTKELTASFGWTSREVFTQHDVQELNRVLQDKIEEKMKGTSQEGTVERLFKGRMMNYIECLNVDYASKREEAFYDVSLVVKGCANVYESFDKYTETELLDGNNQYRAEGHGLQDAKKGVKFLKFPPILHLQLKRFDFDLQRLENYKVNSEYSFPRELDLSKYVDAGSEYKDIPCQYVLQGVLVHSGSVGGGHYYAYFRPTSKKTWYQFNDTKVTKATSEAAIEDNFGGETIVERKNYWGNITREKRSKYTNAYMLQYVRKDQLAGVLAPVPPSSVPEHIRQRFDEEKREKERKKRERREAHLYTIVKIFTDEDLAEHHHVDLIDFAHVRSDRVFRMKKDMTLRAFLEEHASVALNTPADRLRCWTFSRRVNDTVRASRMCNDLDAPLRQYIKKTDDDGVKLLVEISTRATPPFFDAYGDHEAQVFFKFYDPEKRQLQYVTRLRMSRADGPITVEPQLRKAMGLADDVPLAYYEEIKFKPPRIDLVDPTRSLKELEIGNGDIIVFQKKLESELRGSLHVQLTQSGHMVDTTEMELPTADSYYKYLAARLNITFKPLKNWKKAEGTQVLVLKTMKYEEVQMALQAHLPDCDDHRKIRFTGHSFMSDKPRWQGPFRSTNKTLEDMLSDTSYWSRREMSSILYYEVLPFTLEEMKQKVMIPIVLQNEKQEVLFKEDITLDKTATAEDLLKCVRSQASLDDDAHLRLLQVSDSKVRGIVKPFEVVSNLVGRSKSALLAEFESEEERELPSGARLCPMVHTEYHTFLRPFGIPFCMVIHKKEKVSELRKRVAERLGKTEKDVEGWEFLVAQRGWASNVTELKDSDTLEPDKWYSDTWVGMVHPNTSRHYTNRSHGVVIK